MKIGALNHPARNPLEEIEWIGQHGFDFVDFTLEPPAADPDLIDPRAVRAALDRHGLGVVAHTAWFIPSGSPFGSIREASLSVYRLMEAQGCSEELCRAGMFPSIYGTEMFRGFTLPPERRPEVRALLGERAERLAYRNCFMERATLNRALEEDTDPYRIKLRTGEQIPLARGDFDDLCRVHLFDWLEQVPRSEIGWSHRQAAFRRMAERLNGTAEETYDRVFSKETVGANVG